MENLVDIENVAPSYTVQYNAIKEAIRMGDAEVTAKFTNNEYADIYRMASLEMRGELPQVEQVETFNESPVDPVAEELPIDDQTEIVDEDPIATSRKLFDQEQKEYEARMKLLEEEYKVKLKSAELEKDRYRSELDEARKKIDEYSFDENALFGEEVSPVETGRDAENVVNLPQEVTEKLSKIDELSRQIEEDRTWRETVDNYSSFWSSSEGQSLKPSGKPADVLKTFNDFYSDLVDGFGNEKDAFRLMHDMRKNGADKYTSKLGGVSVPQDFDKVYDSFELEQFANGFVIDPVLGKRVPHNRGTYANLEDAYYILNKDKIRVDDKKKAFEEVQEKLRRREDSAVSIEPTKYSPINKESEKYNNREYRTQLFERAKRAGFDGKNLNTIRDVSTRDELAPLWAVMNK